MIVYDIYKIEHNIYLKSEIMVLYTQGKKINNTYFGYLFIQQEHKQARMSIMKAKKTAMSTYAMLFISLLDFAACCRFLNTLESLVSCTFCILSRISLNLSMTLAGMMFKFETSERIRRHY